MTLHSFALSVHVVAAILGLGQVSGTAVLASSTLAHPPATLGTWRTLDLLTLGTRWSLGLMVLSGVLIAYSVGWAYGEQWWLRISFIETLALVAINAWMRRGLRRREAAGDERTLRAVARGSWITCAITAVIAVLMEVKP